MCRVVFREKCAEVLHFPKTSQTTESTCRRRQCNSRWRIMKEPFQDNRQQRSSVLAQMICILCSTVTGRWTSSFQKIEERESRGFAFVRYKYADEAQKAIERLDGRAIDGRNIVVQSAKYGRNDKPIHRGRITDPTVKKSSRSRSQSPRRPSRDRRYRDEERQPSRDTRRRSRSRDRNKRERYRGGER